jgi:membrane associated rhomboid family serine protease
MARRTFLAQVPPITLRLLIATAAATIGGIVLAHAGYPKVFEGFVLQPYEVLHGKVWKLITYVFVSGLSPLQFVFDLLVLYWFGGWFERSYGPRRYLRFFLLSAIGAAILPVLIGLFSESVAGQMYMGSWPIIEALTVAMGLLQPGATINFYMILPVTARQLMYLSWGLIGLFIIFDGSPVPFLTAIGGIGMGFALTAGAQGPRRLWLRLQSARLERQLRRRAQHLRVVPKDGSEQKKTYLN